MNNDTHLSPTTLLEVLLQSFSQGILFAQAVKYFHRFRHENTSLNIFVLVVMIFSALQTAQEIFKLWRISVQQKPWATSGIPWSEILLNNIIYALCQGHLIRRCWRIAKKKIWVLICLGTLLATTFAATIFLTVSIARAYKDVQPDTNILHSARFFKSIDVAFTYWTSGSLVLDTTVTSTLIIYLVRRHTGIKYLDEAIDHFLNVIWESAALPWLSMLIAVILFHVKKTADYNVVLFFVIITGKLYSHGLLRTLNSRRELREKINSSTGMPQMNAANEWPSNPAEVTTASSTLFEHAVEEPAPKMPVATEVRTSLAL